MPFASSFKAYDVRGTYPESLSPDLAKAIGLAYAKLFSPKRVVVGRDCRLSGPVLRDALVAGLRVAGVDVTDIGLCGTEEIYYAAFAQGFDGGIMITGSHNPRDDNGMKFVRKNAVPISADTGLFDIRDMALQLMPHVKAEVDDKEATGAYTENSYRSEYVQFLLDYVKIDPTSTLKIHADAGNGCAGLVLQELMQKLPFQITTAHMEPDGTFPHGIPNPLLPERREATAQGVRQHGADLGIAWDGDFDRCFFYDAQGNFIEGYYLVGLLAQSLLQDFPGAKIIHDPRLIWNTQDVTRTSGGISLASKAGHAFIKEKMREEDGLYGGEMSAHHYFRDFAYCDSGMLPWLLVAKLILQSKKSLADLVYECMQKYPCSGEINRKVKDSAAIIQKIRETYVQDALGEDTLDGLSLEFAQWRFNVRSSNTEPLLRLNVESRGDAALMQEKTQEILHIIDNF